MSHIKHSNPWDLHQRDQPSQNLALKSNMAHIQENHRAVGNGDSTIKGFGHRLTRSVPSAKGWFEKHLDHM